jgi:hypothetical protein
MTRYYNAGKEIPAAWTEELQQINEWLEDEGYTTYAAYMPK